MNKKLNELNFNRLIKIDNYKEPYSFSHYKNNNFKHPLKGFCVDCEKKNICHSNGSSEFQLSNISHAAHSINIFDSLKTKIDTYNWHNTPIMFIFESPSRDYGFYKNQYFESYKKKPTEEWYWVHKENEFSEYPNYFKGREYANLLRSIIITFKLKNAYITNLVKCGLNDKLGNFKGINYFKTETVENCYNNFLSKEIELHNPKIIFTFGSAVYNWMFYHFKANEDIKNLPHPAGRGVKNEYFNVLYFWLIAKELYRKNIIPKYEYLELANKFSEK